MALTFSESEAIVEELRQALVGGFIQKIHQPRPMTVTMDIRAPGHTAALLVCVEPRFARLHLTSRKLENPATPPPFCTFLRSRLEGGRLVEMCREPGDRIIYINILKAEGMNVLVVALTGNQSNLYVLNEEKLVIRSLRESRIKEGERYIPPLKRANVTPSAQSHPAFVRQNPEGAPISYQGKDPGKLIIEASRIKSGLEGLYPISAELDIRYSQLEREEENDSILQEQLAQVHRALRLAKRKVRAIQEDFKKTERFREYSRYGELLKSHLHEIKKGQKTISLVDYYDPALPTLTLPLDSSKDAVWNMNDYFKKYHKFIGAQEHLLPRMNQAQEEVLRLEEKLARVEKGIVDPDIVTKNTKTPALSKPSQRTKASKDKSAPAQGYRTYTSADGVSILVGKTARDNDYLTFKVANPHDLWLHARGTPGSHVVVRLDKGAAVPPETLKDAATLTLWFSDLRKSGKGEVIYTFRKFVKKGKGFKSGAVMVEREKSLWIELKEDRLERLKHGSN